MKRTWLLPVLAVLVAFVAAAWGGADGPKIVYRLADKDGVTATADDVKAVVRVMETRLNAAGYAGIEITSLVNERISVTLPESLAQRAEAIWALAERPGTLEFRILADAREERHQRDVRDLKAPSPPDRRWVPRNDGGPDMLVQVPEEPLLAKLRQLDKAGVAKDAKEYVAARTAYDEALHNEVFTGDQLAKARVDRGPLRGEPVVFFELKEDRKDAFAKFTERHVREQLAFIVDGKVRSAPVISSKLPGEGVLRGGEAEGFTEEEANALVGIFTSGPLPGRLVRVPPPEKK